MSYSESVRLRQDDEDFDAELARELIQNIQAGRSFVAITATQTSYPTSANKFYHCTLQSILGTETEGGSASFGSRGVTVKAYNLGSSVPPVGTEIIIDYVPYRFVFRYP